MFVKELQWLPAHKYPTLGPKELGPLVLASFNNDLRTEPPMLVIRVDGHFRSCPGVPMFYGDHQFGFATTDHVVEFSYLYEADRKKYQE